MGWRTRRLVAVLAVAILTLPAPGPLAARAGGFRARPLDTNPPPPLERDPTAAEKAAATEKMMKWEEAKGSLGEQLGMKNPRAEWSVGRVSLDKQGLWHFKLDQVFKGIHVVTGHLSIALQDAAGFGNPDWHGQYLRDPEVNTTPVIDSNRALRIVKKMVRRELAKNQQGNDDQGQQHQQGEQRQHENDQDEHEDDNADTPRGAALTAPELLQNAFLEIHPGDGPGKRKLTYHAVVSDTSTKNPIQLHAWVGAQADNAGKILQFYNNIQPLGCTGNTFYQGSASYFECSFTFSFPFFSFVLNDNSLRIGAYDAFSTCSATYQASSFSPTFGNFSLSDRESTNADTLWASVQTMSFYYYKLGRTGYVDGSNGPRVFSSVDGLGPLLSARNHVCSGYNNAYWDGQKINLGDGDGFNFQSFATLDIIAHEWTHGVTQFTAGLYYFGESGALNESFSDIFGAMAARYWKGDRFVACPPGVLTACSLTGRIGGEAILPRDALRYMYAPTLDGISPDYYPFRFTGTADNGGVHINSGIQNHAFWLLAYGGCHRFTGCMPFGFGIGPDAATLIFYKALRDYIIPTDNFFWARRTTQWAAGVLYGFGSFEYFATVRAWDLVGVP